MKQSLKPLKQLTLFVPQRVRVGKLLLRSVGQIRHSEEVESNLESLGQSHEQVLEQIEGFRDQLSVCRERVAGLEATVIAKQADKNRQEVRVNCSTIKGEGGQRKGIYY